MRIRKTVSKLLGSAMVCPSHHSPPPSDLWALPSVDDASGLVCELNQSPWDVYPNLHLFNNNFQGLESPIALKKEEAVVLETKEESQETQMAISENTGSILENSHDKPIRVCKKSASKPPKKKNEKKKKKNEIIFCKKNDGKKWFCKRPAQLPHSLCEYHLSQSRSYYNINKEKEACQFSAESEYATTKQRRHKSKENSGTVASPYYYYNGFGPCTRKKRAVGTSSSCDGAGHDTVHVSGEKRVYGCDVSGTGVDEESDEEVAGELASSPNEDAKHVPRKRGRKPIKCRSLKSLL